MKASTEIQEQELALRYSRPSLVSTSALLDSWPDQIAILDESGRIVLTNLAWKEFAVEGKLDWRLVSEGVNYVAVCDQVTGAHAAKSQQVATDIRRLFKGEIHEFQVDYECSTPQAIYWYICRGRRYQGAGHNRVILTHTDISAHEQARLELESVRNELARACRLATIGEMAAGLAHELKQPLAAIGLYAEGCLEQLKCTARPVDELLHKLQLTADLTIRCGQIIDGLRALAGGHSSSRHEIFDVHDAARTVAAIVRHEYRIAGIDFRLHISPEPIWISGAVVQIQQVLLNLIRNAIEAQNESTPAGKRIDVSITNGEHDITFVIRDYGNGIPVEVRERLFEPFFTTKSTGIGMGLRISQAIVRAHGGRLTFEPTLDIGASFTFCLPKVRRM